MAGGYTLYRQQVVPLIFSVTIVQRVIIMTYVYIVITSFYLISEANAIVRPIFAYATQEHAPSIA